MNDIIVVKPEKCVGCNACVRSCPAPEANITKMLEDGRYITNVNTDKCIACGQCTSICPQSIDVPEALSKLDSIIKKLPKWTDICRERAAAQQK